MSGRLWKIMRKSYASWPRYGKSTHVMMPLKHYEAADSYELKAMNSYEFVLMNHRKLMALNHQRIDHHSLLLIYGGPVAQFPPLEELSHVDILPRVHDLRTGAGDHQPCRLPQGSSYTIGVA